MTLLSSRFDREQNIVSQALYTDPAIGLRYHNKSVSDMIKSLACIDSQTCVADSIDRLQSVSSAKEYLSGKCVYEIPALPTDNATLGGCCCCV